MIQKQQTEQPRPTSRATGRRFTPNQVMGDVIDDALSVLDGKREVLANALIAYTLAVVTNHPYADDILNGMIEQYASAAGLELHDRPTKYDGGLNHQRLLEGLHRSYATKQDTYAAEDPYSAEQVSGGDGSSGSCTYESGASYERGV